MARLFVYVSLSVRSFFLSIFIQMAIFSVVQIGKIDTVMVRGTDSIFFSCAFEYLCVLNDCIGLSQDTTLGSNP